MRTLIQHIFTALAICTAAEIAYAGSVYSVKIHTEPIVPYVGEAFNIVIETTVSPGSEVDITNLTGLPATNILSIGQLTKEPVREIVTGDTVYHVHTAYVPARAFEPFDSSQGSVVSIRLTERVTGSFFSSWQTADRTVRADWPRFRVTPLPEEGRPADFNGAVGKFSLKLSATPREIMPNDIVTLTARVTGRGWLGNATPVMPKLDPTLFKVYAPEIKRNPGKAAVDVVQLVIPLSTNSLFIPPATFSSFDTASGSYTTVTARIAPLVFSERAANNEPAIREVSVGNDQKSTEQSSALLKPLNFASDGIGTGVRAWLQRGSTVKIATNAVMHLAPSASSRKIADIRTGTAAEPKEVCGSWTRIRANGHTGWIPSSALPEYD